MPHRLQCPRSSPHGCDGRFRRLVHTRSRRRDRASSARSTSHIAGEHLSAPGSGVVPRRSQRSFLRHIIRRARADGIASSLRHERKASPSRSTAPLRCRWRPRSSSLPPPTRRLRGASLSSSAPFLLRALSRGGRPADSYRLCSASSSAVCAKAASLRAALLLTSRSAPAARTVAFTLWCGPFDTPAAALGGAL